MPIRHDVRRGVTAGVLSLAVLFGSAGTALAVPPPPPNPSDSDINAGKNDVNAKAGEVGKLTSQLTQAEQKLSDLQDDVETKQEQANKALVDLQSAQDAADAAEQDVTAAKAEQDVAAAAIQKARGDLRTYAVASFQQGSSVGSASALLAADNPQDLLAKAEMLRAVGGSKLNSLDLLQQAETDKANKDAAARKAEQIAEAKQAVAQHAKSTADSAQSVAVQAQQRQVSQNTQLQADKTSVEQQLYSAQQKVTGLQGQRQKYQDWLAAKQKEDEERARQAALASGGGGHSAGPGPGSSAPAGSSVEAVIARAMARLGMPYAWGGGNASGPTRGIHDGGVADMYGDYNKIGFDCSGLMVYAFAGVLALPHFSGYQYTAGRHVPLSQMRRGDLLFWGGAGGIHHVALYLGGGQMLEAPESGLRVRIAAVRYGGIMPFATRLIG